MERYITMTMINYLKLNSVYLRRFLSLSGEFGEEEAGVHGFQLLVGLGVVGFDVLQAVKHTFSLSFTKEA